MIDPNGAFIRTHLPLRWFQTCSPSIRLAGRMVNRSTSSCPNSRPAPDRSHLSAARVSFPMAVYVWEDEVLEVLPGLGEPKYPPVKAIAFHTRSTAKFYGDDYAVDAE